MGWLIIMILMRRVHEDEDEKEKEAGEDKEEEKQEHIIFIPSAPGADEALLCTLVLADRSRFSSYNLQANIVIRPRPRLYLMKNQPDSSSPPTSRATASPHSRTF